MNHRNSRNNWLLCSAAFLSAAAFSASAHAETARYSIPPQSLDTALQEFGAQSGHQLLLPAGITDAKRTRGFMAEGDPETALRKLLAGTGLSYKRNGDVFAIVAARNDAPIRPVAAPAIAAPETVSGSAVEGLVVTAQKKREQIQDVPIAISAFSADALQAQKIEGGFDLLKAIPNVTFSKNNFSGYNFSIRGIGTKAISVTTDPGVAVAFNNTTLIRNRLFEQEYFDVERVEVLRGPQGTLYGRNATSGVINLISATPELDEFSGSLKGEVGNYHTKRLVGMVNVPLIEDVLAVRFAGAMTARDGYGLNLYNDQPTDGRDLWSGRITIGFEPTDRFHADLIWERFNEDDDRARTGKQLCHHAPVPDRIGEVDTSNNPVGRLSFTQGCLPGSLYDDAAFGTPNGSAIPFVLALQSIGFGRDPNSPNFPFVDSIVYPITQGLDPYGNAMQSRDLREIYSQLTSRYEAKADVLELNANFDISPSLTFFSQTAYNKDEIYSTQDFNRFTTFPVFADSSTLMESLFGSGGVFTPSRTRGLTPGGVFCDPQLGCSKTIVGQDISRAHSEQFSQEFRLQSDFDGPLNFSLGAGYTRYKTVEDYYVFFNGITLAAITAINRGVGFPYSGYLPDKGTTNPNCNDITDFSFLGIDAVVPDGLLCVPIEQNPISDIRDEGHNYFLSRNPYKLKSGAVFGEVYWQASDAVKITAGLRYTDDLKVFTPIPSQTLLSDRARIAAWATVLGEETVEFLKGWPLYSFASGYYPALPNVEQQWREVTGRFGVDWKPDLSFTDDTMIYAFYSRGYKGGGMNPPPVGIDHEEIAEFGTPLAPTVPPNFAPEFVNAYEIGAKNTLLQGGLIFNATGFYYDYKDYQVSKIVDRTAANENFDAQVWGLELESVFVPSSAFRFNASFGYLDTEIADGSLSIDIMNRTAGDPNYVVMKPSVSLTSNCIIPVHVAEQILLDPSTPLFTPTGCPGGGILGFNYSGKPPNGSTLPDGSTWDPADHPELNYGAGIFTDVSGNELPNSPHWTMSMGAQYEWDLFGGNWTATVRGDAYWQSQSWARVYNFDPYDKLHGWYNANLSFWLERPEDNLKFEIYVKNVLDDTPITDSFLNSDDTALTTNVFVLDPRLIGLQITKGF